MPNLELPILVVDDAKFSSAIINKTLRSAGYRDVRIASNAAIALQMLEKREVSVVLADWMMPEKDGLELTESVRQLDEASNHFTYIILLTANESVEALAEAFDRGVDDFIYKSQMSTQLLPRIYAADRLADMQNRLLDANRLLVDNNRQLQEHNILDTTTGLGNQKMARARLIDMLEQTESRGGVTNYLLIGIKNWPAIGRQFDPAIPEEVAKGIARRLGQLMRPLDTLCRISENQFVAISQFNNIEQCTVSCFRRVIDGINLKAFKTKVGFVGLEASGSVCAIDGSTKVPRPEQIERFALRKLQYAYDTGTISVNRWPEMATEVTAFRD